MKKPLLHTIIFSVLVWLAFAMFCPALSVCHAAGRVIRVGFFEFPGYHMMDMKGHRSGYGYDYLCNIADWTNWEYEYVGYDNSWNDMLEMLKNGEIDLVTSARKTPERESMFLFSDAAIGTAWTVLVTDEHNSRLHADDFKSMNGARIGMLRNNSRNKSFEQFAKEHDFTFVPVYFDGPHSVSDMSSALRHGREIDALITSNLRLQGENERILARFDPEPFYVITRKDSRALMNEINTALDRISTNSPSLTSELTNKYYSQRGGELVAFTAEESAYLQTLRKNGTHLKGIMKPDRYPLSAFDKDGNPVGIVADVTKLVSDFIGVPIDIIDPGGENAYEEFKLDEKVPLRLDTGVFYSDADEGKFRFTRPYLPISIMGIGKNHIIERNDRIAALRNSRVTNKYVSERFSSNQIVYYDTPEECLNAVRSGAVKLTFFDRYSAEKFVLDDYSGELKLYTVMDFNANLAIAVSRAMPKELRSIISKAVLSIPNSQLEHIVIDNNNYPKKEITFSDVFQKYKLPIFVIAGLLGICIALIGVLITRERMLSKTRAEALKLNADLGDANKQLAQQATTDELTGLYNRRFFTDYSDSLLKRMTPDDNLALIMLDLDNFKSVNDIHGHLVGNHVLAEFAEILTSFCNSQTLAMRYGGEEFIMLVQGQQRKDLIFTAEQILRKIQQILRIPGTDIGVTASGGIAVWRPGMTRTELIAEADAKMYLAKNRGKNRIEL